jgi:hypothetical protein
MVNVKQEDSRQLVLNNCGTVVRQCKMALPGLARLEPLYRLQELKPQALPCDSGETITESEPLGKVNRNSRNYDRTN